MLGFAGHFVINIAVDHCARSVWNSWLVLWCQNRRLGVGYYIHWYRLYKCRPVNTPYQLHLLPALSIWRADRCDDVTQWHGNPRTWPGLQDSVLGSILDHLTGNYTSHCLAIKEKGGDCELASASLSLSLSLSLCRSNWMCLRVESKQDGVKLCLH